MMTRLSMAVGVLALLGAVLGCASSSGTAYGGGGQATGYLLSGDEFESCECDIYCPCIFSKDASFDQCRALIAWRVTEGSYGKTDLKGVVFAASLTKSGKNIEKTMGKWEGVIFVSDKSSEEQRKAIVEVLKKELGGAFAKIDVKTVPIEIKGSAGHYEVTVGKVATLKISPLKGSNGQVPVIENAPSPLALPKTYCAKADVHTYDDGAAKWDFAGRNAFYGAFAFKSK